MEPKFKSQISTLFDFLSKINVQLSKNTAGVKFEMNVMKGIEINKPFVALIVRDFFSI